MTNYQKKIYYVTQAQYDILQGGGTVGGYTGIDPDATYFVRPIPMNYELSWDYNDETLHLLTNAEDLGSPLTINQASYALEAGHANSADNADNADALNAATLETTLTIISDLNIPTSKAVATYVTELGYVTSSGVTSVSGASPIVSSGGTTPEISLAANYGDTKNPYASKTAKHFLAAPNAAAGVPSFRTIMASDIPALNYITKTASRNPGYIPTWGNADGGSLGNGYSVETTLTGGDGAIPRADAVKNYVDGILAASDAMIFKGTIGSSGTHEIAAFNALTTYNSGWTYKVITAGQIKGKIAEIGDLVMATVDRTGTGAVDSDWVVTQTNIDGAVVGPTSAANNNITLFSGTTGKIIKDSGVSFETALSSTSDIKVPTSKAISDYIIGLKYAGSSSAGGSATNADNIKIAAKNSGADHYLSFVDSNNNPAAYEALYTDLGLKYNITNKTLTIGSAAVKWTLDAAAGTQFRIQAADGSTYFLPNDTTDTRQIATLTDIETLAPAVHTHTIGYYSTANASDLNTTLGTGQFSWSNSSTNTPVAGSYGQGINIVSAGTAHNNSNNWITQLAFSTINNTAYFRGKTNSGSWGSWHTLYHTGNKPTATDVGLGNVTNQSKTTMFASPTFTGTPLSVTATKGTNTTQIATTEFVQTAIGDYVTKNTAITGSTKTKITYDSKGLVTGGADLVASDIPALAYRANTWVPSWSDVSGKPSTFAPIIGTGAADAVAGNDPRLTNSRPASDVSSWAKESTKPSYVWSEIGSKPSFATVATSGSYNDLSNKPTIPSIPSIMDTTEGNTGTATTQRTINAVNLKSIILNHSPAGARSASDVYAWAKAEDKPSYAWSEIGSKPTNLVTGTGTTNQLTYWTAANTVGTLAVATYPSLTELSYVKGVTSAIQNQINGKQATITGAATTIVSSNLTASMALVSDTSGKVTASSISATKLGYLTDVTSNIQAQLSGKQATLTNPVTGTGTNKYLSYFTGASTITGDSSLQFDSTTNALTLGDTLEWTLDGSSDGAFQIQSNGGATYSFLKGTAGTTYIPGVASTTNIGIVESLRSDWIRTSTTWDTSKNLNVQSLTTSGSLTVDQLAVFYNDIILDDGDVYANEVHAGLLNGRLSYSTSAPTIANAIGIRFYVGPEPATKYAGWIYFTT